MWIEANVPESERTEGYKAGIELARGSLGSVNVGESPRRAVILRKLAPVAPWSDALLDELAESAKRAEVIHHPSLLAVVDSVRTREGLTIVTEYVQGVPLETLMMRAREKKKPMPIDVARRIALDLARAVHSADELLAAHGTPRICWVHPECVLISSGDDALVADVGMLSLTHVPEEPRIAAYRAPELDKSAGDSAASRGAVYSLGILLWELIANRDAFGETVAGAKSAAIRQRAAAGALPRLDLVRRDVPSLLAEIVMQSAHRDPKARFPDGNALAEALATQKGGGPGELVRYMTELCSDLVERQKSALVLPHIAATSWRPTVHPLDDVPVPEIPRAPRLLGLAAFKGSSSRPPPGAVVAPKSDAPPPEASDNDRATLVDPQPPEERMRIEVAAPALLEDARKPQATLPLLLVQKPPSSPPPSEASLLTSTAALEAETPAPPKRRRLALGAVVFVFLAGAVAIGVLALQKQSRGAAEPEQTAPVPPASSAPANPEPTLAPVSASVAPSASATPRVERAERPRDRRDRDERPRKEKKDAAPAASATPNEDQPIPGSDNPYVTPKETPKPAPAPSAGAAPESNPGF